MNQEQAANILAHYIRVALEAANVPMSSDMDSELTEAVEAFRKAEQSTCQRPEGER